MYTASQHCLEDMLSKNQHARGLKKASWRHAKNFEAWRQLKIFSFKACYNKAKSCTFLIIQRCLHATENHACTTYDSKKFLHG